MKVCFFFGGGVSSTPHTCWQTLHVDIYLTILLALCDMNLIKPTYRFDTKFIYVLVCVLFFGERVHAYMNVVFNTNFISKFLLFWMTFKFAVALQMQNIFVTALRC